jgi:hypothetical protein
MYEIEITEEKDTRTGWIFHVTVDQDGEKRRFVVELDNNYYRDIGAGIYNPQGFVIETFNFLLEREKKEEIEKKFNVREVQRYFPEYEDTISK